MQKFVHMKKIRNLIFRKKVLTYLWKKAIQTTNYISNQILHWYLYSIIFLKLFLSKKLDISHL